MAARDRNPPKAAPASASENPLAELGGQAALILNAAVGWAENLKAMAEGVIQDLHDAAAEEVAEILRAAQNELDAASQRRATAEQEAHAIRAAARYDATRIEMAARESASRLEQQARSRAEAIVRDAHQRLDQLRGAEVEISTRLAAMESLVRGTRQAIRPPGGQARHPLDEIPHAGNQHGRGAEADT